MQNVRSRELRDGDHGFPAGMGTNFTVIPWKRGDLLRQYRGDGLLIFNVIVHRTINCELAEFEV